jgi:hypothetical protein
MCLPRHRFKSRPFSTTAKRRSWMGARIRKGSWGHRGANGRTLESQARNRIGSDWDSNMLKKDVWNPFAEKILIMHKGNREDFFPFLDKGQT